jgi:eukaryotic-like serine/threonine-protein kinase
VNVGIDEEVVRGRVAERLFGTKPSRVLLGRFEILRELGSGGMGIVYEAYDAERKTVVAIKTLVQRNAQSIARLKHEFRALSELTHPNLVRLEELRSENDQWFFTMELVRGLPFQLWVRPEGQVDHLRLRSALGQLAAAVGALHAAGKVHLDLKPSNVLVTEEGRVVVLDFGLVRELADGQESGTSSSLVGTPAYLAPEQAGGEQPTAACDWYAVGVMLFEALTGRLPFAGNPFKVLRDKQTQPAPTVAELHMHDAELGRLCLALLARDPRMRATGGDVACALGVAPPAPRSLPRPAPSFIGRRSERAALFAAAQRARDGELQCVFISGPSGIGKTGLLDAFCRDSSGTLVVRCRCNEKESLPYKIFDGLVDGLSRHLRTLPAEQCAGLLPRHLTELLQLFPVLGEVRSIRNAPRTSVSSDLRERRNAGFGALKELLLRLCDRGSLVLVIDDLQWGDLDSVRMLAHVLGRPEPPALLLVGAFRSEDLRDSDVLNALCGDEAQLPVTPTRIELDALTLEEATELADRFAGARGAALPAGMAAALAAEADGFPFLLSELIEHATRTSLARREAGGVEAPSIDRMLLDRVHALPADGQRLLRVLSLAASPLAHGVATDAAGIPREMSGLMLDLCAARLVRRCGPADGDRFETYHDRIREIVAAAIADDERRVIHMHIVQAMTLHGIRDPEQLIEHYAGAGDFASAGAAAVQAARSATAKLAFNRAAQLYARALELRGTDDPDWSQLCEQWADALAHAGRSAQAAAAYLRAAGAGQDARTRRLLLLAAQQYLRSGRIDEGMALARQHFRAVGLALPTGRRKALARYVWHRALSSLPPLPSRPSALDHERLVALESTFRELGMINPLLSQTLQLEFLRYARKVGDRERICVGMAWRALLDAMMARQPDSGLATLRQVEAMAAELGTPYAVATAKSTRAGCAVFLGRNAESAAPAAEAEKIFRESCPGSDYERVLSAMYRYNSFELTGGIATIQAEVPALIRDAAERDDQRGSGLLMLYVPFILLTRNQPGEALRYLAEQHALLSGPYSSQHLWLGMRKAHALMYAGDFAAARAHIALALRQFQGSRLSRCKRYLQVLLHQFVRAEARACRGKASRADLERMMSGVNRVQALGTPQSRAAVSLLLAEVGAARGDWELVRQHLEACANGVADHQTAMFASYAKRSLGLLLGGDAGASMVSEVDVALRADGVLEPAALARVFVDVA